MSPVRPWICQCPGEVLLTVFSAIRSLAAFDICQKKHIQLGGHIHRCVQPGAPPQKRAMFGGLGSSSRPYSEVQVDVSDMNGDREHYMETDENRQFRQEFDQRKAAQDEDLDFIEKGLGNLQNIAQDMGAELNKQDVLIDEIDKGVRRLLHFCLQRSL